MAGRVELAGVAGVQPVAPALWLLHLDAPAITALVRPGHVLLARCADPRHPTFDPFLPRAYFVFAADRRAGRLSLLVEVRGRGSAWLASRREGDHVLVHGPIGREIRPGRRARHLLLLADGASAVAGMSLLAADATQAGLAVTLIANAVSAPDGLVSVPPGLIPADVEYRTTTPDAGGLLGALSGTLSWADEVVVAAPWPLLESLALLRRARLEPFTLHAGLPVQAIPLPALPALPPLPPLPALSVIGSSAAPGGGDALPCGRGTCGVCGVPTGRGRRLFCRQGPAFPLETLRFDLPADDQDDPEGAVDGQ